MFKIGLLDNYNKNDLDTKQTFDTRCEIYHLSKETVINQLSMIDGLVMHYRENAEKSELYEQVVIIRNVSVIPIWVVSEVMSSRERLTFLKLGVLVIIKKGIFDEELSLSLVNALKIVDHRRTITNTRILSQSKNIEIIDSNCSIRFKEGQIVHLTRLEFQLILELAKEPNKAVSYEELTTLIWSDSVPKGDIYRLANLVFNVRKKLREENIDPSIIKTIRSRGYMLTE
ncbi:winged helix-turn-helix domain-containing protein [Enterococcus rivorum]|uniref:OmpR/PhoB-type domain-containing protein n=1 Tax=Enterococcus rivorum TaxID=762845 RepID=A0A1E5KUY9_9ENTE|nr:winged helix-turn-helix domain-containing protein [Enterococcus rivorum]MBP2100405.1 DNA-binding response OmpR family regulator [Enterococcus rivorum]OEH81707.1 hypothetical protein BCR26_15725 [Enterococcus rivorum]